MASVALQPNILAAPAFQLVMFPPRSAVMIASPEDSPRHGGEPAQNSLAVLSGLDVF